MESNIILLIIGIIVLIVSLVMAYLSRDKRNYNKVEYQKKYKTRNREINIDSKVGNEVIIERIKNLEQEVLQLKQENNVLSKKYKNNNISLNQNNQSCNNFKPILNHNLFKQKNSAIIDLYKKGKPKEEIARTLNKSITEIEMVISLVE